jgi:Phage integrase, N-terminal SAM-like domain
MDSEDDSTEVVTTEPRVVPGRSANPVALAENVPRPMTETRAAADAVVPAIVAAGGDNAMRRFLEFFAVTIDNPNTRAAYFHACRRFFAWCERREDIEELADIEPMHVAAYIRGLGKEFEKPTVKQHLAAIRMLFDWLVTGQIVATNPAHAVRGPKHVVKTGKTTVLTAEQARELLDSIDVSTLVGLRDRALIAVMTFAFARMARSSPCASRIIFRRANAGGCGCTRKAASATKCRRITLWKPISTLHRGGRHPRCRQDSPVPLRCWPHRRADG